MNILVTGADGQLGNCLRNAAAGTPDHYIFTDVAELDITDPEAVRRAVSDNDVKLIINCAAFSNVDKAEDNPEAARRLNVEAVATLAAAMKEADGTLIHFSTDYVFGGERGNLPRTEDEPTNPTGIYALTKLQGEQAIAASGAKALIFRTAWLYSEYGHNFVKTMLSLTASKPQLNVVFDQCGTPTYAQDLAEAVIDIVTGRKFEGNEGTYHFSNEGVCSWYDFARAIAEFSGHRKCAIRPCHTSEFPSRVVRPPYSVLDKTKIKETFGLTIPHWIDSLKVCLFNLSH